MLVSSYLTVSPLPARGPAVCSLWHFPAGRPGLPLTTTLLCGVRTFLGGTAKAPTRPPGRLVRRAVILRAGRSTGPAAHGVRDQAVDSLASWISRTSSC